MTKPTNTYTSRQGDTLSKIAYEYYGSSTGQVERILEANPKLCQQPPLLPAGIIIVLPDSEPASTQTTLPPTLNLWD